MNKEKIREFVAVANGHFAEQVFPQIEELVVDNLSDMVVYISGSVANGFCDDKSDVDIELFFTKEIPKEIIAALKNNVLGDKLTNGIRLSYWMTPHSERLTKLCRDDLRGFWEDFNPYFLHDLQNFIPLYDKNGSLNTIQQKVKFYPSDIYLEVVRGLWITVNDSGIYSSKQANDRGNWLAQNVYYFRVVEAILRLAYVLNGKYYPATKWLHKELGGLGNDFGVRELLDMSKDEFNVRYNKMIEVVEKAKIHLEENEIIEEECIENYGLNFSKPYFIFRAF